MGFGLPAIATTGGGASEIITPGQDGFLVPPGDTAALGDCLSALAQDRPRLAKLSLAARRRYLVSPDLGGLHERRPCLPAGRLRFAIARRVRISTSTTDKRWGVTMGPEAFDFIRYLAAKKSVDDRALNLRVWQALERRARQAAGPLRVLEIGAGTGVMLERMLERRLLANAVYTGIDAQAENIAHVRQRLPAWAAAQGFQARETAPNRWQISGPGANVSAAFETQDLFEFIELQKGRQTWDLLVAHAFLDLVDIPATLPGLLPLLSPAGLVYFSVNFDGATIFEPAIDARLDERIQALYHRSMDERITNGRLSGDSRAGRHLFAYLRENGIRILEAGASDWVVFPQDGVYPQDEAYFLHFIIHSLAQALAGHPELDPEAFAHWIESRHTQIDRGEMVYIAHQLDFAGALQLS